MQQQIQFQTYKLGLVCPHGISKTSSNYVDVACIRHPQLYHRVSQASKICNKCATIIMRSVNSVQECPCCSSTLQQLIKSQWICTHRNRNIEQITIKCLNNEKETHDVPFRQKVCKICYQKIRASFMFAPTCAVCDQKQTLLLENIEKTITNPSFYFFESIVKQMKQKKFAQAEMKAQIEHYCLAEPRPEYESKFASEMIEYGQNLPDYHQFKRYQLYPKCPKHRNNWIGLCNNCLVSILNLNSCPYGCESEKKEQKGTKADNITINESGFLCMYPKITKDSQYIQLFTVRHIQESNRMDKWQSSLKKIKYSGKQNIENKFSLYAACAQVSKTKFVYCGGVMGQNIQQVKTVGTCFEIILTDNNRNFNIESLPDLEQPRSGHCCVYHNDYVYIISGYFKEGAKFLSSCQKLNLSSRKWEKMASLSVERSKASAFQYQGNIFLFGGLSLNEQIWKQQCEKYSIKSDVWESINYLGFDVPFLTSTAALTKCWGLESTESLLIFGGSDYSSSTNLLQEAIVNQNGFQIKSLQLLNFKRDSAVLSLMKTQSQNQKILVIFGGVQEHQPFLSFDAVRVKVNNGKVHPIFVYDNIQIGSYRLLLRQNAQSAYSYMKDKLMQQGILSKSKLESEEDIIKSEPTLHVIQKMWYGVGKCFVGFNQI